MRSTSDLKLITNKMPLFETVLQEKPPVVLEIGSAYTKIGFASESYPRFIIPSETFISSLGKKKNIFDYSSENELYDLLWEFFQTIFFKYVLVNPRDRRLVIVESAFCPTKIRENIAKCLFRRFDISSILFVPTHLVVLATLVAETALVVDFGYNEITVMPVYSGVQILHAFQAQPFGGKAIHEEIKRQLLEIGVKEEWLTEKILEDIKVRICFVTTYERAKAYREGNPPNPPPDVDYSMNGKKVIKIPGRLRETAMEIMFLDDNENSTLPHLMLESILKCSVDTRKDFTTNILLIGGSCMIMGLKSRLKEELIQLVESTSYNNKLFTKEFKFHSPPSKANFTAWLGGSIYGGTDLILKRSLTKETYAKCPRVPDWSNLDDNRRPGSS